MLFPVHFNLTFNCKMFTLSGLLDLLCNILVLLPENDLSKILGVILKPETLLVMVHHQAPEIRNSIIRVSIWLYMYDMSFSKLHANR